MRAWLYGRIGIGMKARPVFDSFDCETVAILNGSRAEVDFLERPTRRPTSVLLVSNHHIQSFEACKAISGLASLLRKYCHVF